MRPRRSNGRQLHELSVSDYALGKLGGVMHDGGEYTLGRFVSSILAEATRAMKSRIQVTRLWAGAVLSDSHHFADRRSFPRSLLAQFFNPC